MKKYLKEDDGGKMEYLRALEKALEKENYLCTWGDEPIGNINNKKLVVDTDLGMFDIDYVPGEWVYVIHFSGPDREFTKYREYTEDVVEIIVNVMEDQLDDWCTEHYVESKKPNKKKIQEKWRGADITYEWELREQFQDLIEHSYMQSKGKLGKSEIEQAFQDAMDDILENDPSYFHFYDDVEDGWYFVFGTGNYSVYQREGNEFKVEWSDGVHSIEPILCSSEEEARQTVKELQDAEK